MGCVVGSGIDAPPPPTEAGWKTNPTRENAMSSRPSATNVTLPSDRDGSSGGAVAAGDVAPTSEVPPPENPRGTRYVPKTFHARGGMGEVWLSQDSTIGRDVAMKILRRDSQSAKVRFVAEA